MIADDDELMAFKPTYQEAWESSRMQLSHDWLRNGLAITLGKVTNVLSGLVEDPQALAQLRSMLQQWPARRMQALAIVETACDVQSPKRLFESGLLSNLDSESKKMFGDITETVWRRTQLPEELVVRAYGAIGELDTLALKLCAALESGEETGTLVSGDISTLVDEMRHAASRVSAAITDLGRCRCF